MRIKGARQLLSTSCLVFFIATATTAAEPRPDIIVADFEGDDYGDWKATGTAFGKAPAQGTLPGQMEVSGFEGRGLVNSFNSGDDSTGTLSSPAFVIQRPYLCFLIGGGGYANETCVNLRHNGATVRTSTGPNTSPGGSERLEWSSWDVSELLGQTVAIEVVDHRKGGWGHINVDQIVQSDRNRGSQLTSRTIVLGERYLHLPVQNTAPVRKVTIKRDGLVVRAFDIKLAEGKPDFWVFDDLSTLRGSTLRLEAVLPAGSNALASMIQSAELPNAHEIGHEPGRPRYHFTSRRGWLNDPNGLVFQDGEYHLFYQHNPYGWDWGNMHWGHAVSPDLVHWSELGEAIRPRAYGDWAFSGSAVVDRNNTSGFGRGNQAPMVAAFTSTGRGECIAFSNDGGRSFAEYEKNPVLKHRGRDPRLFWHEPTKRWGMAVYDEAEGHQAIAFHSSEDLKTWRYESRIEPFFECPDIFELPVAGAEKPTTRWVLYAADGKYLLGSFDGKTFSPDSPTKQQLWYGNFYAAQTFSGTPDGRRIQVGWARGITFPGEPFNQQMTVPVVLTLRTTPSGIRLFAEPVTELKSLRTKVSEVAAATITAEQPLAIKMAETADVALEMKLTASARVGIELGGSSWSYDASKQLLTNGPTRAPLALKEGVLRLRILLDRGSVELFANEGAVAWSLPVARPARAPRITLTCAGGEARLVSGQAYDMGPMEQEAEPNAFLDKQDLFKVGDDPAFRIYHIPGIVVTAKGTALAWCEARKHAAGASDWDDVRILLRRSTDDGRTWSPPVSIAHVPGPRQKNPLALRLKNVDPETVTYNNPVLIADRDGTVHMLFCLEYMRCFYQRSDDDGQTWTAPREITPTFEAFKPRYPWAVLATGPNHGIQLKSGRLIVPVWLSTGTGGNAHRPSVTATIYSDDHGRTWQAGEIAVPCTEEWINPNEAVAVELADGRVMLNVRSESKANRRLVTTSPDGATRWSTPKFDDALLEPICMAGIVRYRHAGQELILFSNPHNLDRAKGPADPGQSRDRKNLGLKLSRDEGQTWDIRKTIEPGPSMYSDLAVTQAGTILCFYGRGNTPGFAGSALTLARFNLDWLNE